MKYRLVQRSCSNNIYIIDEWRKLIRKIKTNPKTCAGDGATIAYPFDVLDEDNDLEELITRSFIYIL